MAAIRDVKELNPLAQTACNLFLAKCKEQGLDIFITETYRSQSRQNQLYAQGRTAAGAIVTNTKSSNHTARMAWDIATQPYAYGGNLYHIATLRKAGEIAKSLGITWGGNWESLDMPHFEITNKWQSPKEEVAEMRYKTINDLPDWAKPTIEKLVKDGKISDGNNLDMTLDMVRVLAILNR